jgi:hypothetical protein
MPGSGKAYARSGHQKTCAPLNLDTKLLSSFRSLSLSLPRAACKNSFSSNNIRNLKQLDTQVA